MASEAGEVPARKQVGKLRLLSLEDLDRRTKAASYAEETKAAIEADLGGADRLSAIERIQVQNLALNAAVLTDMHVRWLMGETIDLTAMVSVENVLESHYRCSRHSSAAQGRGRHQLVLSNAK